jgi:hypothetical protein
MIATVSAMINPDAMRYPATMRGFLIFRHQKGNFDCMVLLHGPSTQNSDKTLKEDRFAAIFSLQK